MRKSATVSAPGKFHLIGEHSSVYGKPALLCAINKRISVTVSNSTQDHFFENDEIVTEAFIAIRTYIQKKYNLSMQKHTLEITADLPVGIGLGSSAALCAAIAGAFFRLYNLKFENDKIFDAAYNGEKVFHGNPSGGDLAVCVYGGAVWFRKETENIKLMRKIDLDPSLFDSFLLIDSGKSSESTKYMVVDVVGKKYKNQKNEVESFLTHQELLTKELSDALLNKDEKVIASCLLQAGSNLEKLGIVGKKAKGMINILENNGLVGKVSGGGGIRDGSGMIVAFGKNKKEIIALCRTNEWEYLDTMLESEGVRIDP